MDAELWVCFTEDKLDDLLKVNKGSGGGSGFLETSGWRRDAMIQLFLGFILSRVPAQQSGISVEAHTGEFPSVYPCARMRARHFPFSTKCSA